MKKVNLPAPKKINFNGVKVLNNAETATKAVAAVSGICLSLALSVLVIDFSLSIIKDRVTRPLLRKLKKAKKVTVVAITSATSEVVKPEEKSEEHVSEEKPADDKKRK